MFKWIWTIFSLGAPELGESESWIKLVTSNYCTCDLWTTLLLGGKTFPIIEAFFFFFGFEFRPHSIIPVTWNQYNIYSHTSGTYHSVEGHHWLIAKRTITKNRFVSPWKIVTLVGGGSIAIWGMEVVKKSRDLRSPEVGISVYGLVTRQIISLKVISLEILSQVAQNFIMLSN